MSSAGSLCFARDQIIVILWSVAVPTAKCFCMRNAVVAGVGDPGSVAGIVDPTYNDRPIFFRISKGLDAHGAMAFPCVAGRLAWSSRRVLRIELPACSVR